MWELALSLGLISLVSEGFYGATTFGPAISFNIGWQICYLFGLGDGTLPSIAENLTIMETFSAILQIVVMWEHVDPWLSFAISAPVCIFTGLGQLLMIRIATVPEGGDWLKRVLGIILVLMAAHRARAIHAAGRAAPGQGGSGRRLLGDVWDAAAQKECLLTDGRAPESSKRDAGGDGDGCDGGGGGGGRGGGGVLAGSGHGASGTAAYVHDPPGLDLHSNRVRLSLFFWCSFAGCMAGLTSVGGPPLMIFVSLHAKEIKMDTWRGSNAVGRLLLNVARGVVFARNGSFDGYLERTAAGGQWPVTLTLPSVLLIGKENTYSEPIVSFIRPKRPLPRAHRAVIPVSHRAGYCSRI